MATLSDTEILDLVKGTLYEMGPPRFQQIAQNLPDYEVMGKWLKKDRVVVDSGIGIQRAMMTKLAGAAKHVGLGEIDDVDIPELMNQIQVPWRHLTVNWAFERRETLMNRGKSLIFKVIEPRRVGAMIDVAEELETNAWKAPSSSSDKLYPYGLPYYLVMNSSTGFTGTVASGHTTVAGISTTTTPAWKNYAGTYSAVGKAAGELIKVLRTAHRKTRWKSPVTIQDFRGRKGEQRRCYTDETTISAIEDVGEAQNENLGRDVASMDGTITFRKHPIIWVSQLDSTPPAANPFYMVDHATFYPVVLSGDFLRESEPMIKGDQHNIIVTHVDLTYNFVCIDRRRNTALYLA